MEQKPKLHDWCFIVLLYLWSAVSSQSWTTGSVTTVLNLVRLSYNLSNIVSFFKINVTIIEWSYILKGKSISLSFSHVTCNTYIQHILYNTNYWSTRASQVVLFGVKKKKTRLQCRRHERLEFDFSVGKIPWGGHGNPLPVFFMQNPMDRGAQSTTVHGVTKSWMQLKLGVHGRVHWSVMLLIKRDMVLKFLDLTG